MYGFWNLMAGTNGFYLPYILRTVGNQSQAMSVGLQALSFLLVGLGVALVFMPLVDRTNQKRLFMVGAVLQICALLLFALFPLGAGVALAYVVILGVSGGFAAQPFFQLWSGEMFPTTMRSTAQGLMFAIVRISLGIWSFYRPGDHEVRLPHAGLDPHGVPGDQRAARAVLRAVERRQDAGGAAPGGAARRAVHARARAGACVGRIVAWR